MDAGKLAPAYQWRSLSGLGLSALPMVVHGARNGLCPSPVTSRVRGTGSPGKNVMQKAMMQMHDAGWVGRDLPTIATTALTASGLPVGGRMPPVRQPGWLFQSCKALEGQGGRMATGCHHHGHLRFDSWPAAVWPARIQIAAVRKQELPHSEQSVN